MTTSRSLTDKVYDALVGAPGVQEKVHEAAAKVMALMKAGWPESIGDELTDNSKNFSHTGHSRVFELVDVVSHDGRPVTLINVNHPHAVEHQAKTGGFTKAVSAAGFDIQSSRE